MKGVCELCLKALAFGVLLPAGASLTGLETDHLVEPGHVGARPSFAWRMETARAGARQVAYRVKVARVARNAASEIVWDSGEVADGRSVGIAYAGTPLESARWYAWTVAVKDEQGRWAESVPAHFSTGLLGENEWNGADWIAPPDGAYGLRTGCFRRALANPKRVVEAWWCVTASGVFEIYANGRTVTDEFLKPGYTHPLKVRQACTYDVTAWIDCRAGATNVFCAVVSPSWSRDKISCRNRPGRRYDTSLAPTLRAVLILRHADGTETRVVTDRDWRAAMDCYPVRTAGIYEGESVDARTSLGWLSGPEPDWPCAISRNAEFSGTVRNFRGPPVTLREDLATRPVSAYVVDGATGASADRHGTANVVRRARAGMPEPMAVNAGEMLVLDFGQNASVAPEFVFEGARGMGVELRFAEMLNEGNGEKSRGNDGPARTPYLANLRTSYAGVRYVCRGGGAERYRPTFSFFGCRYASVTAEGPLVVRSARSIPVTSVGLGADTGSLVTDNPRVNRLFENCRWGMYSNYLSVPTDCPQRDERVGWTADTQVFAPAAAYLADTYAFLAKWMADMRDSQRADGCYPWVAPESMAPGYTIGWTDAGVIVPYVLWRRFGDAAVIRENWESMDRYMAYVAEKGDRSPQPFGDWLSYEYGADMEWLKPTRVKQQLPRKRFLSYVYRIWTDRMMAEMADALGDASSVARYRSREQADTAAFRASCLAKDGTILPACDGQCSALYALLLDILPTPAAKTATRAALRENFRAHGECLQTGFLGTAILLDAVTRGMEDSALAYTLLLQDKDPSWLYSVDQGATTVWERWNSYTKERGFGPVSMNSFNHYAYGAVAGWMFSTMAGIRDDPAAPGFRHFALAPVPDPRIGKVDASFRSPYGTIASKWEYGSNGEWKWTFTIPANTTATVVAPGRPAKEYVAGSYTLILPCRGGQGRGIPGASGPVRAARPRVP